MDNQYATREQGGGERFVTASAGHSLIHCVGPNRRLIERLYRLGLAGVKPVEVFEDRLVLRVGRWVA